MPKLVPSKSKFGVTFPMFTKISCGPKRQSAGALRCTGRARIEGTDQRD